MLKPQDRPLETFIRVHPVALTFSIRRPKQQLVLHNTYKEQVFFSVRMLKAVQKKYSISCPRGVIKPGSKLTITVVHKDTVSLNTKEDYWKLVFKVKQGETDLWGHRYITAGLVEDGQPQVVTPLSPPDLPFDYLELTWPFPDHGSQTGREEGNTDTQVVPASQVADSAPCTPKTTRVPQLSSGWRFLAMLLLFIAGLYVWRMAGYSPVLHAVGATTVLRIVVALFTGMVGMGLWWWLKDGVAAAEREDRGRAVNQTPAEQQDDRASSPGKISSLLLSTLTLGLIAYILFATQHSPNWSSGNMFYMRHGFFGVCGSLLLSITEQLWRKTRGGRSHSSTPTTVTPAAPAEDSSTITSAGKK